MAKAWKDRLYRLLRWSERYTGTDMVYLASGSFWLFWSQAVTAIISFGMAVAFANFLPKEDYGIYKYLLTILGILTVASLRGMDAVVTQASARGNDHTVIDTLRAKIRWGLLGSLASAGFAAYYWHMGNTTLALAFALACFFVPVMDSFGIYSSILTGKREFRTQAIIDSLGQVVAAIALLTALLLTRNPIIIFLAFCGAWTAYRLWGLSLALRRHPPNDKREPQALSYGWHSSLINSASVLIASLDSILVFHYLGAAELAVYTFAMAPVMQARTALNTIMTLSTPKFAPRSTAEIRAVLGRRSLRMAGLGALLALVYIPIAPLFYRIFFHQYLDAVVYSQIFAVTFITTMGYVLLGGVINSRITLIPKRYLYLWNIPSLILALCSIVLIRYFGIWGAILGQVLSSLTSMGVGAFLWFSIKEKEFDQVEA